ncbi:DUF1805 domain-containing protein [Lentisphaerota bacterium ZTH]|nr:DUF1805 domain-containing protein [Lentisphaerota bacterium]WET06649.1 DUF1805 domain-containing protein [Lentisphaerota bacterium ZTH]
MDIVNIDGQEFKGFRMDTENACVILIKAAHGFLGCGYFDIAAANKLLDDVAIVKGVNSYDDMLQAEVVDCSDSATAIGVRKGMTGREALLKMT